MEGRGAALIRAPGRRACARQCAREEEERPLPKPGARVLKEALGCSSSFSGEGFRQHGKTLPSEIKQTLTFTLRQPLGVVALITPWNFPFAIPAWKSAPALVSGNTVVMKPATNTPATATLLAEILHEAGLPKGVFNLVDWAGGRLSVTRCGRPPRRPGGLFHQAPTALGLRLNERCARRGIKVTCEMGGKNPVVVLNDADLALAASGILSGAFGSTGQRCTATSRVVVQKGIARELTEALVQGAKRIQVGNGLNAGIDMGPAVDEAQLKTDLDYVRIAQEEGAKLLVGGNRLTGGAYDEGYFVSPAVVTGVKSQGCAFIKKKSSVRSSPFAKWRISRRRYTWPTRWSLDSRRPSTRGMRTWR